MREVSFEKTTERSYGFLLWVLLFLVGAGLGFIKIDNTFWYKSATLAYALSSIIYLSTVLLRDRTIQRLASFSLFLGLKNHNAFIVTLSLIIPSCHLSPPGLLMVPALRAGTRQEIIIT